MEGIFAHAGEKWHHLGLPDLLEAFLREPPTRLMGMYTGAATVAKCGAPSKTKNRVAV